MKTSLIGLAPAPGRAPLWQSTRHADDILWRADALEEWIAGREAKRARRESAVDTESTFGALLPRQGISATIGRVEAIPRNRVSLIVSSDSMDPDEITTQLGLTPDGVRFRGELNRFGRLPHYDLHSWELDLHTNAAVHFGVQGLSDAVVELGPTIAARLRDLVGRGATVHISMVQYVYGEDDTDARGISLSEPAIEWMAAAKAGFSVDQYFYASLDEAVESI